MAVASLAAMPDHLRHDGRAPDQLREVRITRNWLDHAEGSVLVEFGRTRVLCAASFTRGRAALAQGPRHRLGHRGVRDAARARRTPARTGSRGAGRSAAARTRSAASSAAACGRSSTRRPSARTRSSWTATSSRPTAAPAPRPSPGPGWPSPTPSPTPARKGSSPPGAEPLDRVDRRRERRPRRRPAGARPRLPRGLHRPDRHERRHDRRRPVRRGAGHRGGRALRPGGARRAPRPRDGRLRAS